MLSAIDVPKSKSITIAFLTLKLMALAYVFVRQVQSRKDADCQSVIGGLITLYQILFLISLIFDACVLLYFYFTIKFSRLQYYIFFILHLVFAMISIIATLTSLGGKTQCHMKNQFLGTTMMVWVSFLVMTLFLMSVNLYLGFKIAHFGCNIIWTFMYISEYKLNSSSTALAIVAGIHGLLSASNLGVFIFMKIKGRTTGGATGWRYSFIVSIIFMFICYVIVFIDETIGNNKLIFTETYKKIGILELLPPALLLVFLKTESGDPRNKLIRQDANAFLDMRQNKDFIGDNDI